MMEILSPDLLWIGDRCYRLPTLDSSAIGEGNWNYDKNEVTEEPIYDCEAKSYEDDGDDGSCDVENQIEAISDNRFKLRLPISQAFWSKIVGIKGVTRKRIETETKTTVIIPRPMEHGDIIIKGSSKRAIILAKKSIEDIVSSTRQKLVFTHFISIPMNGEEIKKNFITFKDEVLKLFGKDRGVDESIFQNPDKLHLTIGTLVLTDQNERNLAEKLLNEIYEKKIKSLIANSKNCIIEMKGIEYMNDDPSEVDVLYGEISTNEDVLQKAADEILHHFSHHKLIKSENMCKVKLHVTLMNTIFRDEEPEEMNEEIANMNRNKYNNKRPRRTFNASNILRKFEKYYFGRQTLKTIQLSVRYSTGKDGYYKSSCVLNL